MQKRLAVLVSGTGSTLEAIIKGGLRVDLVIADRACRAIEVAAWHCIPRELVLRFDYCFGSNGQHFSRAKFTEHIAHTLHQHQIDLAMMTGFMTRLDRHIFHEFPKKILNTHPSLLPAFKGLHAVRDALHYGVKIAGCTLHYATEELDEGSIIDQRAVRVLNDDTEEVLHSRIKAMERIMVLEHLRLLLH